MIPITIKITSSNSRIRANYWPPKSYHRFHQAFLSSWRHDKFKKTDERLFLSSIKFRSSLWMRILNNTHFWHTYSETIDQRFSHEVTIIRSYQPPVEFAIEAICSLTFIRFSLFVRSTQSICLPSLPIYISLYVFNRFGVMVVFDG